MLGAASETSAASASDASQLLTVVVCSSPVPSNPQTATLQAVLRSLRRVVGLPRCQKVIQLDGPQRALPAPRVAAYAEFTRRVHALSASDADFAHSRVYASPKFLFASHNLAAAISHVNTSFLLSLQHDYELARPFDLLGLLHTMRLVPIVRHVRLNMRANAPARGFDGVVANATDLPPAVRVPLTRTCGWSDAPHVASTAYYRSFVIPKNLGDHNGGRRKFMEESVHYPMQRNGMAGGCWETRKRVASGQTAPIPWPAFFDDFGTYLYGVCTPTDGFYTLHHSLRGNVGQWGIMPEHKSRRPEHAAGAGGVPKGRGRGGGTGRGGAGRGTRGGKARRTVERTL